MAEKAKVLLHKHASRWELPSVSAGCIQAEAYLRMADVEFVTEELSTTGTSPTGLLPAVDTSAGAGGFAADQATDLDAAVSVISFLQANVNDMDRALDSQQNADRMAFACLIESKLNPAVLYTTWCEWHSVKHLRAVYGDTLPWPLNYIIPFITSVTVKRKFKDSNADEIYSEGCAVLKAVQDRLGSNDGMYLLGKKPCSLDAKLYGLLAYMMSAPIVAPLLKNMIKESPTLLRYVEGISQTFFSMPSPSLRDGDLDGAWSPAAKGTSAAGMEHKPTEDEKKTARKSMYWIGGVAALMAGYVVLGGQYFEFSVSEDLGDEEDDD